MCSLLLPQMRIDRIGVGFAAEPVTAKRDVEIRLAEVCLRPGIMPAAYSQPGVETATGVCSMTARKRATRQRLEVTREQLSLTTARQRRWTANHWTAVPRSKLNPRWACPGVPQ